MRHKLFKLIPMKDPRTQMKIIAKKIFKEEIIDLEKEGYLIMYKSIPYYENYEWVKIDVDLIKEEILYPVTLKKPFNLMKEDIYYFKL